MELELEVGSHFGGCVLFRSPGVDLKFPNILMCAHKMICIDADNNFHHGMLILDLIEDIENLLSLLCFIFFGSQVCR